MIGPTLLIERRRRARTAPAVRVATIAYVERQRYPFLTGVKVAAARWIRRRAFRIVRWTQQIEARADVRAMAED